MDKITMLGTGHAMTMDCFNTCFVYENEHGKMLVDTGGGGQLLRQLRDAGIPVRALRHIFISHRHTDHLLGLPWIIRGLGGPEGGGQVTLHLHPELMETAWGLLELLLPEELARLGPRIQFQTIHHREEGELLGRKVRYLDLHSPNVTQYGFVLALGGGGTLAFHGDVPFHEDNRGDLTGVRWLMHEAFCLSAPPKGPAGPPGPPGPDKAPPRGRGPGHSTVRQAAAYAQSLGAENLILYHGSDSDLAHRRAAYTAEARTEFTGGIFVPNDLDVIDLT